MLSEVEEIHQIYQIEIDTHLFLYGEVQLWLRYSLKINIITK